MGAGAPYQTSAFSMKMSKTGNHCIPSPSGLSRGSTPLLGANIAAEKGVDPRDKPEGDDSFFSDHGGPPAGGW
jgi:hypothetical protein